jgi:hypothetical protein
MQIPRLYTQFRESGVTPKDMIEKTKQKFREMEELGEESLTSEV